MTLARPPHAGRRAPLVPPLRYQDRGDGTVLDTSLGLLFLRDTSCLPSANWTDAKNDAATLADGMCGLTDGSSAGDWRLPTRANWALVVKEAKALGCTSSGPGGAPSFTNKTGMNCWNGGPSEPFASVPTGTYWSSEDGFGGAWGMSLTDGESVLLGTTSANRVWPVRPLR